MSTLVLSLLLLLLIVAGMLMAAPVREYFESGQGNPEEVLKASPALANLFAAQRLAPKLEPLQVDTLARDQDLKKATESKCPECPVCPKQEECPDMSQYIRLDEIPCWNCSLP